MKTPNEIKKGLRHCSEDGCKRCPYEEDCHISDGGSELAADALDYIRQLEKQLPRWISVKGGLPKAYRNVDVVHGSHDSIGYYSALSKRWYDSHDIQIYGVTHWKYRDDPPKED